ncbi:MAG: DUF2797 domain-containing protein [Pseudomonadales bacterium]|nr:DUF2797 domain-containing protein [Pseudomonadales bacterium]
MLASGNINKMHTEWLPDQVQYHLPIGDQLVDINALIGRTIHIDYQQQINCQHCGRKTKKSFNQGYCYPCFSKLARCDSCIVSPEKCHFEQGSCREPDWAEQNCFVDHYVYLANSSGLKVGITRGSQIPTRWIDQGAIQALPILRVSTRQLSGLCEVVFKQYTADKTNWRKMLKNEVDILDMRAERDRLFDLAAADLQALEDKYGLQAISRILDAEPTEISFPVEQYPTKVVSFNLDKNPELVGKLMGIKGQYLILDSGVINMRKYSGYQLNLSVLED